MTTKVLNRRQARWLNSSPPTTLSSSISAASTTPPMVLLVVPIMRKTFLRPPARLSPQTLYGSFPIAIHLPSTSQTSCSSTSSECTPAWPQNPIYEHEFVDFFLPIPVYNGTPIAPPFLGPCRTGYSCITDSSIFRNPLRLDVIREHHDGPLSGHPGVLHTCELITRNYYFPRMQRLIKQYVDSCHLCQMAKPSRHARHGELAPLPVPTAPWTGLSCDFITDLPVSNGMDSILVFVDRMTKMCHFIPCLKTTSAPDFAKLFVSNVVRLHGLPTSIVSDRGSIFTSNFWSTLAAILKIDPRKSTAFSPPNRRSNRTYKSDPRNVPSHLRQPRPRRLVLPPSSCRIRLQQHPQRVNSDVPVLRQLRFPPSFSLRIHPHRSSRRRRIRIASS